MPDYCDENTLVDFFSSNFLNKKKSETILKKTIKIAHQIKNINHSDVNIIVSLAGLSNKINRFNYYKKIKKLTEDLKKRSINLLPQWLPVDAWYFGGNVKTEAFSNPKDLKFLKKIKLNICLDLSHYILSCNYYNYNLFKYFHNNVSIFKHYHVSDAKGTDGEGILIGKGEIIKSGLLDIILKDKHKVKVLETWQGHLNDLSKFKEDINTIVKILK
jgi:N-acetylneuraminate synthase